MKHLTPEMTLSQKFIWLALISENFILLEKNVVKLLGSKVGPRIHNSDKYALIKLRNVEFFFSVPHQKLIKTVGFRRIYIFLGKFTENKNSKFLIFIKTYFSGGQKFKNFILTKNYVFWSQLYNIITTPHSFQAKCNFLKLKSVK